MIPLKRYIFLKVKKKLIHCVMCDRVCMLACKCIYTCIMAYLYSTIENMTDYYLGLLAFEFNQMFYKLTLNEV